MKTRCLMLLLFIITVVFSEMVNAQSGTYGVELVGRIWFPSVISGSDTTGGSDCWGYTAPDGTEYALMGVRDGIAVVKAVTLEVVTVVAGPTTGGIPFKWRDIKTYRHYAYAVAEQTGFREGVMIIDLRPLPDSVRYVGSYVTPTDVTSHNLSIDTTTGYAYVLKSNYTGFRIISLADPENPVEVGSVNTVDIHDVFARNDTVWVAEGNHRSFSVYDVTNKSSPVLILRHIIPAGGYVHNIWPTDNGRYAITTEETPFKTVKIWDISNPASVTLVGQYLSQNGLAHNVQVLGNRVYISHYEAGVTVIAISSPSTPIEIARFDTYTQSNNPSFRGCWGAYPYTRNGLFYASDIEGYLTILRLDSIASAFGDLIPSPPNHNFGNVEVGTASDTLAIQITNTTENPISIAALSHQGGGFLLHNVPPLPAIIPPAGAMMFRATFHPVSLGFERDTIRVIPSDPTVAAVSIALLGKGVLIWPAQAGQLYATSAGTNGILYTIELSTGLAASVGPMEAEEIQGLAIKPSTRFLHGVSTTSSVTRLYKLSVQTGDAALVTEFSIGNMRAIAFSVGDTLYGATTSGRLYRLNPSTAETTFIGAASGIVYSALAFSPVTGELWASVRPPLGGRDRIYKVSTVTGQATFVGSTGDNQATPSIAFGPEGTLYGLKGMAAQVNTLIQIDTATAAGTLIGSTGVSGLLAIAMRTDSLVVAVDGNPNPETPKRFVLEQNYPNPFNPATRIGFQLAGFGLVSLKVYDLLGREVATLVNEELQPGSHEVTWDAHGMASGVYFCRLAAGSFVQSRKLVLMR